MVNQDPQSEQEQTGVGETRRRLLRAAVAAVPVIATLRSGAAAAAASTAQCIIGSRTASQTATDMVAWSDPPPDKFLRWNGEEVTLSRRVGIIVTTVTKYTIAPVTDVYYNENGTVFNASGYTVTSRTPKLMLRVFVPTSDSGDPINNPTSVDNCAAGTPPPSCIWPVTKRSSAADNTAIFHSCLCSVNPGLPPTGAC